MGMFPGDTLRAPAEFGLLGMGQMLKTKLADQDRKLTEYAQGSAL